MDHTSILALLLLLGFPMGLVDLICHSGQGKMQTDQSIDQYILVAFVVSSVKTAGSQKT
jgi:hypothetical protein